MDQTKKITALLNYQKHMQRNKIIFAIIFIIGSTLLGYLLYRVFFYTPPTTPPTLQDVTSDSNQFPGIGGAGDRSGNIVTPPDQLPITQDTATGGTQGTSDITAPIIKEITSSAVSNVTTKSGVSPKFYSEQDGKFYKLNAAGEVQPLSDKVFFNVQNVTWSPTQNETIIEYPDGANIYYNFDTKEQVTLPKHWESFSFDPSGQKIASKSMSLSPENRWLVSADPKGGSIELIEALGTNANEVIVDWSPNKQVVALSTTGQALGSGRQEVLFIGQNGENFPSTVVEGRGLKTQWSKNGSNLLYSVHSSRSDFKPELWIVSGDPNSIGSGRKFLQINTWADKCAFADDRFVFCGVPTSLDKGVGFAPSLADGIPDELYKIDSATGLKSKIPFPDNNVIDSIFLSDDQHTLYFTDKNQPGLFEIAL